MEYSAVTHPFPLLRRKCGTVSSTVAAHSTWVFPTLISAEPSAVMRQPVTISTGRISAGWRLSGRIFHHVVEEKHDQQHSGNDQNDAGDAALRGATLPGFSSSWLKLPHNCDGITPARAPMQELKLMTCWNWIVPALLLGACGRNVPLPLDLFPETVANVWRRTAWRDLPVSEAPAPLPRTSVERVQTA